MDQQNQKTDTLKEAPAVTVPVSADIATAPLVSRRRSHKIFWSVLVVCVLLLGLMALFRQNIDDWWRLYNYHPSSQIQQLADQDTMTPYARHMFYLNEPAVLSSVGSFRQNCPENKDTIVLGCYHGGENGIYIYNVKDPALQGVSQVTAAHETLHAIYERLDPKERASVNKMLSDYYKNGLHDDQVRAEIQEYQKTEPNSVLDEMHSTFGTEVANLPAPLETYYKKYFTNRQAIVNYSNHYEGEFTARQAAIAQDDKQLAAMKQQIDSLQASLESQSSQLDQAKKQLNAQLAAGQIAAYNAAIPAYNAAVNSFNANLANLKQLINQYNQLVVARNSIASELTTLDKALDTRLTQHVAH